MNKCEEDSRSFEPCRLCPRMCGAMRLSGERGFCEAGMDIVVARSSLHFWEEPPISGNCGSGTVFFSFCSLRCLYCQNHKIAQGGKGRVLSRSELVESFFKLKDQGAMNINLVTPTHFAPSIRSAVQSAISSGFDLPFIWNTGGYENTSSIYENGDLIDIYLTDMKYSSSALATVFSHAKDYPQVAMDAIRAMIDCVGRPVFDTFGENTRMTKGVIVRHLLLPGHLDDSKEVISRLHSEFGGDVLISIMNQYTPILASMRELGDGYAADILSKHPELGVKASASDYERLLDFADSIGVEDYFWQDGEAAEESFIPDF